MSYNVLVLSHDTHELVITMIYILPTTHIILNTFPPDPTLLVILEYFNWQKLPLITLYIRTTLLPISIHSDNKIH